MHIYNCFFKINYKLGNIISLDLEKFIGTCLYGNN